MLLPTTPVLGAVMAALLIAAAAVAAVFHLVGDDGRSHARRIVTAGLRACAQLAAVSVVIGWVTGQVAGQFAFVALMVTVATVTAGRRITPGPSWPWAAVPILAGTAPVLLTLLLTRLVPPDAVTLVPVAGILTGGALTATTLAGRRALEELTTRHGEVEAALALGLPDREARLEIARPAASGALLPGLDQTRTVGLVTLPGAFVGMLLGGASPAQAGAVQLFVLVALMAVQAVAVAAVLELVARARLHR
ncbi:ABC transporter permease [Streptomyces sp. NPDC049881]|uniref:ABC transporter permease n=1 Tax=unclassified Streptomyces TaxID=2593676 RepID=UPI00342E6BBF